MSETEKYYGHAVIRHPEGWSYLVLYLTDECTLRNSAMLAAWQPSGALIKLDNAYGALLEACKEALAHEWPDPDVCQPGSVNRNYPESVADKLRAAISKDDGTLIKVYDNRATPGMNRIEDMGVNSINAAVDLPHVSGRAVQGTLSNTEMTTDLAETIDHHYTLRELRWVDGQLAGRSSPIVGYIGSITPRKLIYKEVPGVPVAGDQFVIV